MHIQSNVPLKDFSTMRLGGDAKNLAIVTSKDELMQAVAWAQSQSMPLFVLGGGSNVIVRDEGFNGLIIVNKIAGFDVLEETESTVTIRVGSGENWDETVQKTVDMHATGIEAMSMIPGTVGATPVQNVGAYGQEIADTLTEIEAYDLLTHGFVRITKQECGFSYRNSVFKSTESRRYVITSVTMQLRKGNPHAPFYDSLQTYFEDHGIDTDRITPADVRKAVIQIRMQKLPDPSVIANTGSFFKNPIIEASEFERLATEYKSMPHYSMNDGKVKLAAGWLIEQTGLKGYESHGMKTFDSNALVFTNTGAHNFADLEAFKNEVTSAVYEKFGVQLEQEPEIL